jgi:hypothetical protein
MRTFRKSAGTLCTAPEEIAFLVMDFILLRYAAGLENPPRTLWNALAGSKLPGSRKIGKVRTSTNFGGYVVRTKPPGGRRFA